MQYKFEVQEPDEQMELVPSPRMVVAHTKNGHLMVSIYFMANAALEITGGFAKSSLGKIKLQYLAVAPSGAYTASQTLRKIVFVFTNPQGSVKEFEFHGQKI